MFAWWPWRQRKTMAMSLDLCSAGLPAAHLIDSPAPGATHPHVRTHWVSAPPSVWAERPPVFMNQAEGFYYFYWIWVLPANSDEEEETVKEAGHVQALAQVGGVWTCRGAAGKKAEGRVGVEVQECRDNGAVLMDESTQYRSVWAKLTVTNSCFLCRRWFVECSCLIVSSSACSSLSFNWLIRRTRPQLRLESWSPRHHLASVLLEVWSNRVRFCSVFLNSQKHDTTSVLTPAIRGEWTCVYVQPQSSSSWE